MPAPTGPWKYRFFRHPPTRTLRVLLFPAPGCLFPRRTVTTGSVASPSWAGARLRLDFGPGPGRGGTRRGFRGFAGSTTVERWATDGSSVEWDFDVNADIIPKEEIADRVRFDPTKPRAHPLPSRVQLGMLLAGTEPDAVAREPLATQPRAAPVRPLRDLRVQNPSAGDSDDYTAGIAPPDWASPFFRRNTEFDRKLAAASQFVRPKQKPDGPKLAVAPLFTESMAVLRDPTIRPRVQESRHRVACALSLVLVFDDPGDPNDDPVEHDPVKMLFAPNGGQVRITIAEPDRVDHGTVVYLPEQQVDLVPPWPPQPAAYALVPGRVFPHNDAIFLTWEFRKLTQGPDPDPVGSHPELLHFQVARSSAATHPVLRTCETTHLRIKAEGRADEFVAAPFQFMDSELAAVPEGELLEYHVRAVAPERTLAECVFKVRRRTVRPLPAPSHAQLIHAPGQGRVEVAVALPRNDLALLADLRLQVRPTERPEFGFYGLDAPAPGGGTAGDLGAVAQGFRSVESGTARAIPWEETFPVEPIPVGMWFLAREVSSSAAPAGEVWVARANLAESEFRALLPEDVRRAPALLLFAGFERTPDVDVQSATPQPVSRSLLTACRHAVLLPPDALPDPSASNTVSEAYLTLGSRTSGLEEVPPAEPLRYVPPEFLQAAVEYRDNVPNQMHVRIRHQLPADRAAPQPAAYRLFLTDACDPQEYPGFTPDAVPRRPECVLRVLPDGLYRATPGTLRPANRTGRTFVPSARPWSVDGHPPGSPFHDASGNPRPVTSGSTGGVRVDRYGAVWLHQRIKDVLEKVCAWYEEQHSGVHLSAVLQLSTPLPDRTRASINPPPPPDQTGARGPYLAWLKERFEVVRRAFGTTPDPFAWNVLEGLGLSCECTFETGIGDRVGSRELFDNPALLARLGDFNRAGASVAVVRFLADDGHTTLDVVRLVATEALTDLDYLSIPIALLLRGRDGPVRELDGEERTALRPVLPAWLAETEARRPVTVFPNTQPVLLEPGSVVDLGLPPVPGANRRSQVTMPIRADGRVGHAITVSDRLAHRYLLAAEVLDRYSEVWRALKPPEVPDPTIPRAACLPVHVERTAPLAPDRVLGTPLPSAVQAFVLRHPSEIASLSNSVAGAHGEFSSQRVSLEMAIDPAKRGRLDSLYRTALPGQLHRPAADVWAAYRDWFDARGPERVTAPVVPSPSLLNPYRDPRLDPIRGNTGGVEGVDRYVFPFLPAYYEYSVSVQTVAGRVATEPRRTPAVRPQYDGFVSESEPDPAQLPRVEPARDVALSEDGQLTFTVPLVYPRFHMREDLRKLWIDAEEAFPLAGGLGLAFGSLPDLFLKYNLFVRQPDSPAFMLTGRAKTWIPLGYIAGPLYADPPTDEFQAGPPPQDRIRCALAQEAEDDPNAGQLVLRVAVNMALPQFRPLATRLFQAQATGGGPPEIILVGDRAGALSRPVSSVTSNGGHT